MNNGLDYTAEGLAKASECLGQLNSLANTPGYGQLKSSSTGFIWNNKAWYKDSEARKELSNYNTYFRKGYSSNMDGRQKDLEEHSADALIVLNRTIGMIAQNDADVLTYFRDHPVSSARVSRWELFGANFVDAMIVDPINGVKAWLNGLYKDGESFLTYSPRLSSTMDTGSDNKFEEGLDQASGTLGYATGSIVSQAFLGYVGGPVLSKVFSATQGVGVGTAYGLKDDGVVTPDETYASVVGGTALGLMLDFGGGQFIDAFSGSAVGKATTTMVATAFGAEAEEVAGAHTIYDAPLQVDAVSSAAPTIPENARR